MKQYAYPDCLSNLAVEAFGKYVSQLLRHLVTSPEYERCQNRKRCYYEGPCRHLQELINCLIPPIIANEVTIKLLRHLNQAYCELMKTEFRDPCEVIASEVLNAIIHKSVSRLECFEGSSHPSAIDIYKLKECNIIYTSLPHLRNLRFLRLGWAHKDYRLRLNIKNVTEDLEEFSSRLCWDDELEALSKRCRGLKILDMAHSVDVLRGKIGPILKFKHLEELNMYHDGLQTQAVNLSKALTKLSYRKTLNKEGIWTRRALLLTKLGCSGPQAFHVRLLADSFPNLTSLALCSVYGVNLTPLRGLKQLRTFSLKYSYFNVVSALLQSIGHQLRCLDMADVYDLDLEFIGRHCSSLRCLHLGHILSLSSKMSYCSNFQDIAKKFSLPEFPSVHYLQLEMENEVLTEYIMSRYVNVRQLYIKKHSGFQSLFQTVLQRKHLQHIEQLFWGSLTVVQFFENYAVITCDTGGNISVNSVQI
jgi:hypothetical protein